MPDSTAIASFGPMPLIADQPLEQLPFEVGEESIQLQRVLAHVRVDAQRDLAPLLADVVEGRQRDVHFVPDALHVDDDPVRLLVEHAAAEKSRSSVRRRTVLAPGLRGATAARSARRGSAIVRRVRRAGRRRECRWQMATASASAASCGVGACRRPSSSLIICCTCVLLGAAVADDRPLHLCGRVLDHLAPGFDGREHRHAARVTELERAARVDGVKEIFDRDAVGLAGRKQRRELAMDAGEAMRKRHRPRWR